MLVQLDPSDFRVAGRARRPQAEARAKGRARRCEAEEPERAAITVTATSRTLDHRKQDFSGRAAAALAAAESEFAKRQVGRRCARQRATSGGAPRGRRSDAYQFLSDEGTRGQAERTIRSSAPPRGPGRARPEGRLAGAARPRRRQKRRRAGGARHSSRGGGGAWRRHSREGARNEGPQQLGHRRAAAHRARRRRSKPRQGRSRAARARNVSSTPPSSAHVAGTPAGRSVERATECKAGEQKLMAIVDLRRRRVTGQLQGGRKLRKDGAFGQRAGGGACTFERAWRQDFGRQGRELPRGRAAARSAFLPREPPTCKLRQGRAARPGAHSGLKPGTKIRSHRHAPRPLGRAKVYVR